jgi:farnesyl-diphosphate farnesyltransferase
LKDWRIEDEYYQKQILRRVSRSFALTIPQLPVRLRTPVANAYLLCRIADTIEDESALGTAATLAFLRRFVAVVRGKDEPAGLVEELLPQLSRRTSPAERELVRNMERIIRVNTQLRASQRCAIERCVRVMCDGMHRFQRTASLRGLPHMRALDEYCYYVAGVVGELLTELFCDYSPKIAKQRNLLHQVDISFGQGLQMTNVLKDMWEDRSQGTCWLPQDIFSRHDIDVVALSSLYRDSDFAAALSELIGVTHAHLRNALSYTLLIPAEESGIRRFCLWAIGLALLTLQNMQRRPYFTSGEQVKVSHAGVIATQLLTSASVRHDWTLIRLFQWAARGLPLAPVYTEHRSSPANYARDDERLATLGRIR